MKYTVHKDWFFPSLGDKAYPGDQIDLPQEVAENLMHNEPGLLTPVRMTTQSRPKATARRTSSRKR